MKRHLQMPTPQPAPVPTLSVEEEAILADEHNEASQALDQATTDADRVTEVAEVAQDAVQVVDMTPQVGQIEAELVEAVGDMAVAGTDADGADVISVAAPTEGDEPKPEGLSVEGIVSTLKSIWDAIVTAIKNMWVGLKHWLTTYFSTLEQNKKQAEKLLERLAGMKGWLANDGAQITSSIRDIFHYSGSSYLDMSKKSAQQNAEFQNYVLKATEANHNTMLLVGAAVEYGYQNYDGMDLSNVEKFAAKLAQNFDQYVHTLGLQSGKSGQWESKPIGQMKVVAKGYNDKMADPAQSVETRIALLSKIRLSVDQDTSFSGANELNVKLDITPDVLAELVKERLNFINDLLKFQGDQFHQLEGQVQKVEKACSDMLGRIKEDNKDGTAFAKRMMPMTTAYANWATQPTAGLFKAAARHNKFWLSMYEMATNNFREA